MQGLKPSGLKSVFDVDNTHPLFKGTDYEKVEFGLTIDVKDWYFKASLRASMRAAREIGTPPELKEGEVEDVTSKEGLHRHLFNRTTSYYTIAKYKFVVCITDWYGFLDDDGEELPCDEENVLKFVEDVGYQKFFDIIYKIIDTAGKKTPEEKMIDMGLDSLSDGPSGITARATDELD